MSEITSLHADNQLRTPEAGNTETPQKSLFVELMAPGGGPSSGQPGARAWDDILMAGLAAGQKGANVFKDAPAGAGAHAEAAGGAAQQPPAPAPRPMEPRNTLDARASEIRSNAERNVRVLEGAEREHKEFKQSESYLGRALDLLYPQENRSLRQLAELRKQEQAALNSGDIEKMHHLTSESAQVLETNESALAIKRNVDFFGSTAIKTGFMFLPGRVGLIGAATAFGLDSARPASSVQDQLIDGVLGMAKGGLSQYAFEAIGQSSWNVGVKAVSMSLTSRALDNTFMRQTWLDKNGNFDPQGGAQRALSNTFNPRALAVDGAVLGLSQLALLPANGALEQALERSALAKTVSTATLFGLSSGGSNEALRQSQGQEDWNLHKIWEAGASQAVTSGLSALSSGLQSKLKIEIPQPASTPLRLGSPALPALAGAH